MRVALRAFGTVLVSLVPATGAGALELKAIIRRPDGVLACFLDGRGRLVSARAGDNLHDVRIVAIGDDSVRLRPVQPDAGDEFRLDLRPADTTLRRASAGADGKRVSLDLRDDDPHHALRLLAEAEGGADLVIHEDVRTPVTLAVRDAPIEAVRARLLDGSGVCRARRGAFQLFTRCPDLPTEVSSPEGPRSEPISLDVVRADVHDVLRLFADVSGVLIPRPPELAARKVTIHARERPWDEVLDSLLAVYGMAWRIDGNRLLILPKAR